MGILNVTPDSFSDGGLHCSVDAACQHAVEMLALGADIIDIGGESTRPGADDVGPDEQLSRVIPVITALRAKLPDAAIISIDTRSAVVADAALRAGARIVNDVSAGATPGMFECVARHRAAIVLMHMQGTPATMQQQPHYDDVVEEVRETLLQRAVAAKACGIPESHIALDPGIGFGKSREHNLRLLAALGELVETGYAVLLGTSRKRFMGAICAETVFTELVGATCATTALGVTQGASIFRVHDIKANRQAADVAWACKPYAR
jgi:dihydropteroate synthase